MCCAPHIACEDDDAGNDDGERFTKGSGNLPSDFRYSSGLTANNNAITRLTVMMNRLSMVRKSPELSTLMIARARKARATRMQMKFKSPSSLRIGVRVAVCTLAVECPLT